MIIIVSKEFFFIERILKWHEEHRRVFPWRKDRDPYRVLVAELMLQRTRAKQVSQVYSEFIKRIPAPKDIAKIGEDEIAKLLEPLGLKHRIPRFISLLKKLASEYEGEVPSKIDALLELPGVGKYVANAVLCFGFGLPVPIVDVNVARVLSRFFGISPTKRRAHTDGSFWELAERLIKQAGDGVKFNEAILDFAALVCSPKPQCGLCPLSSMCAYFNSVQK